jgi:hypothetical protein
VFFRQIFACPSLVVFRWFSHHTFFNYRNVRYCIAPKNEFLIISLGENAELLTNCGLYADSYSHLRRFVGIFGVQLLSWGTKPLVGLKEVIQKV